MASFDTCLKTDPSDNTTISIFKAQYPCFVYTADIKNLSYIRGGSTGIAEVQSPNENISISPEICHVYNRGNTGIALVLFPQWKCFHLSSSSLET